MSFLKHVSSNFALFPWPRYRMCTAHNLTLNSPSSRFLLFAVDVLENAKFKSRSQHRPPERVAQVLETSKERTIIVKQDKFRDLGIRTDPWLLVFFLWFQVQNRMSRSATASKRRRKRYRLYQRDQYCLKNLCIPAEAPIPESSVDYQRWSDETDDKVI